MFLFGLVNKEVFMSAIGPIPENISQLNASVKELSSVASKKEWSDQDRTVKSRVQQFVHLVHQRWEGADPEDIAESLGEIEKCVKQIKEPRTEADVRSNARALSTLRSHLAGLNDEFQYRFGQYQTNVPQFSSQDVAARERRIKEPLESFSRDAYGQDPFPRDVEAEAQPSLSAGEVEEEVRGPIVPRSDIHDDTETKNKEDFRSDRGGG